MLKLELEGWKKKLPALKDQHDKLCNAVALFNTNSVAMRASLEDIEL